MIIGHIGSQRMLISPTLWDLGLAKHDSIEWGHFEYRLRDPDLYKGLKIAVTRYNRYIRRQQLPPETLFLRDPLKIAEVAGLIKKTKAQSSEPAKKILAVKEQAVSTHTMTLRSQKPKNRRIYIPCDILWSIIDFLPDLADTSRLLQVLPHWQEVIPNELWKRLVVRYLVLQDEELSDAEGLDWRYLFLHADEWLSGSHGWRNRKRILGILQHIKAQFLDLVQKEVEEELTMEAKY
ncbi:hypothetical protein N7474_002191 [Penicillium riverlandense]|uniref:uncharacterized protein n=1 Tax=Penicillium riverlandense TaxID=1903569 RepID=UPI002548A56C|nr:uncharacterized protein N7474_002191 [Penicillium riverlandense]KAJ5833880.1 hypothetical protein N7474_002191 [Penicillium riverlandense]